MATAVTAPAVHGGEAEAARLIRRTAARALLFTAGAAAVAAALAPFAIPFVLGDAFEGAALPLALLMPGVVAYAPVTGAGGLSLRAPRATAPEPRPISSGQR